MVRSVPASTWGLSVMEETPEQRRQTKAFALVGEFIFHWNYIESRMTVIIQNILRLPHPESEIVLANLAFRDKTSMASTLCNYAFEFNGRPSDGSAAVKLFSDLAEFSGKYRNVIVHNIFDVNDYGGIEIFRVVAKRKFDMPTTIWDVKFFEDRFREIDDFDQKLEQLESDLRDCPMPSVAVDRFLQGSSPTQATFGPENGHPQSHPPQGSTDSPPQPPTTPKW